ANARRCRRRCQIRRALVATGAAVRSVGDRYAHARHWRDHRDFHSGERRRPAAAAVCATRSVGPDVRHAGGSRGSGRRPRHGAFYLTLMMMFAGLALMLALTGTHSVMAYATTSR